MELVAIFALVLAVSIGSAFNVRGRGNKTIQPVMQHKEAESYSRITNGLTSVAGQFPYQVGLKVWRRRRSTICGGSLISKQWVLTAAHCTIDAESVDVHLGSERFERSQTVFHAERHNIIENGDYNRTTDEHDIGLIRIPTIKPSNTINTVRLPPRVADPPPSHIGEMAFLAGWGLTSSRATSHSPKLQFFLFTVISNEECTRIYVPEIIGRERLCTSASNRISGCMGDSGGPLVLLHDDVQIGILSYGGHDCEANLPMVFARVDSYLDWINLHTHLNV